MSIRFAAALVTTSLLFGPPGVKVEIVANPANAPVKGAVFMITGHHHGESADVVGRAEGLVAGKRVTHVITLTPTATKGLYGVTPQWDAGQPWVLVFSVHANVHSDSLDVAEAAVRIGKDGKVVGIDYPLGKLAQGTPWPRKVAMKEIETALIAMARE